MKVAFTGSQKGTMTSALHTFREWVINNLPDIDEFHHGVCVGADVNAHYEVYDRLPDPQTQMHYHPCTLDEKQAFNKSAGFKGQWYTTLPPIMRNHDMVDICDILIAMPRETSEVLRSGTWATIRYAKKENKRLIIIWPSGKLEVVNE